MVSENSEPKSPSKSIRPATGAKRAVFLVLAGLFFLLGVLGLAVPGLPGTPFFLLTSYFLVRSSPRLNERLLESRLVGPMLKDWQERGGVRTDVKVKAISAVLLIVGGTLYFSKLPAGLNAMMGLLAAVGIGVIWCLPNVRS